MRTSLLALVTGSVIALSPGAARADVTWPDDQLLPSFSAPAPTQDLIYLRGIAPRWEAEAAGIGHATGHADGDGWLCQVGVDAPATHMVYGPYTTGLPAGQNTARFRIKIDNNTADNAHQVTIDVRDNTTGAVLASQAITRQQFTSAGDYVTFALPFTLADAGHSVELRVWWAGGAYIKVDWVGADRGPDDHLVLFATLKGVVNATQPRIFSYEGDAFAEGPYTWLESLGLQWTEPDPWSLITKYRSELDGVIVYDDAQPHTINLATAMAGPRKALVTSAALLPRLTGAPYNLPVLEDLRGRFASKLAVYEHLRDELWPALGHRVLVGLSPQFHKAALREYVTAIGAAVIWLDPLVPAERAILDDLLDDMEPGDSYLGWWPDEGPGVDAASQRGVPTIASDYATNLTVHSGMPRDVAIRGMPAKPRLGNRIYVAFILSDGDNLQYVEHLMRKLWNDPGRGHVPIGWTVSPAMLDAMPGALNYYFTSATPGDNLISGPSGYGYAYPNVYPNQAELDTFAATTDDYARRSGLRVVTVWNTIVGGIDGDVGATFAARAPSLLGLTAQNTGGGLTIYDGSMPGFALSCNYCTNQQAMLDHIASASNGWDGNAPRFVLIQAQPWQGVTPTTFRNVQDALDDRYEVVRPDTWFQLLRQANGLPIEPIEPLANGRYRMVNRGNDLCVESDGADVWQAACDYSDAQLWDVTATSNGYVRISPALAEGVIASGSPDDGADLSIEAFADGAHQQWQPVWEITGHYHFIARHSDRCLDVPGGSGEVDLPLQQWSCNGLDPQAFALLPPSAPPDEAGPDAGPGGGDVDAGEPSAEDGGAGCCSTSGGAPGSLVIAALVALIGRRASRGSRGRRPGHPRSRR